MLPDEAHRCAVRENTACTVRWGALETGHDTPRQRTEPPEGNHGTNAAGPCGSKAAPALHPTTTPISAATTDILNLRSMSNATRPSAVATLGDKTHEQKGNHDPCTGDQDSAKSLPDTARRVRNSKVRQSLFLERVALYQSGDGSSAVQRIHH